jgi:hypothetical protein
MGFESLSRRGTLHPFVNGSLSAFRCCMCGSRLRNALPGSHPRPFETFGFGQVARLDASLKQPSPNGKPRNAERLRYGILRHSASVESDDLAVIDMEALSPRLDTMAFEAAQDTAFGNAVLGGDRSRGTPTAIFAHDHANRGGIEHPSLPFYSGRPETLRDHPRRDAHLFRDLARRHPGAIFADHVVHKSLRQFSGHVYNLQTKAGWYVAQNVIVYNCRCLMQAFYSMRRLPVTFAGPGKVPQQLLTIRQLGQAVAGELSIVLKAHD